MKTIAHDRLLQLLRYEPESGKFFWVVAPGFRRDLDGSEAGTGADGVRGQIMVDGTNYRTHRLAWLYMTGEWPRQEIDHRDTDPSNNRWNNLRDTSRTTNQQNLRRAHADSSTGLLGVVRRGDSFRAAICANRKRYFLGTYSTAQEAHAAYVNAKRQLHEGNTL